MAERLTPESLERMRRFDRDDPYGGGGSGMLSDALAEIDTLRAELAKRPGGCEGCGAIGAACALVRLTNGALRLCQRCLDDFNAKNPELDTLRAELTEARHRAAEAEQRYEHHMHGCSAEYDEVISLGMTDCGGDEEAGVWRNARAEKAEAALAEAQQRAERAEAGAAALRQRLATFLLDRSEWYAARPALNAISSGGHLSTLLANLHNEINAGR